MKNTLQRKRSLSYLFFLAALTICVCLQIVIAAVQPQGLLAALGSLFHMPGYVSYPYNTPMQVTLLSSPTALYAGAFPNSFVLSAGDGTVEQKVPENLFAVYNDIIYTNTSTSDSQSGATQVRAMRESDGKELWSYSSSNFSNAQLTDGILFFILSSTSQQGIVQAHDPINGRLLWQYSCSIQNCYVTFLQVQQGIAYLVARGDNSSTLLALRASDGKLLWQVSQYMYAWQPLLTTNHLLVRTATDTLTAYRPTDGQSLWQIRVLPAEGTDTLGMTSNGAIDLVNSSNNLYAFNAESGALLWQRQDSPFDIQMSNTTIYLSEPAGLIALNATTGQQMWQQIYPSWAIQPTSHRNSTQRNTMLGEANGNVYMLLKGFQNAYTTDGVFAFNASNGQLAWQRLFTLPTISEMSTSTGGQFYVVGSDMEALLAGNTLYFTGYEAVTTIESFHMTLSVYQTLSSIFNTTTYTLYSEALDEQTGNVKWKNEQVEQFHVA